MEATVTPAFPVAKVADRRTATESALQHPGRPQTSAIDGLPAESPRQRCKKRLGRGQPHPPAHRLVQKYAQSRVLQTQGPTAARSPEA